MRPEVNNDEIKDNLTDVTENEIASDDFVQQGNAISSPDVETETTADAIEGNDTEDEGAEAPPPTDKPSDEVTDTLDEPSDVSPQEFVINTDAPDSENYLLYGSADTPIGVNYGDTLKFLIEHLGYDGGELRQARQNKDGSGIIKPVENATEFCSYCNLPISGVDYYRLPDGRKRCTNCNRSLVKSLKELNTIFNEVLVNMEIFFGATIDVPIHVEMLEERKLKKKISKGLGMPPKNVLILGVAVKAKDQYTIYIENGIPRASLIATLAHELTHIWQYTHWNDKSIIKKYGSKLRLIIYEGMSTWTEVQYLYHIGEQTIANRLELTSLAREDEYGKGFALYVDQYPLNKETKAFIETPFSAGETPIEFLG